MTDRIFVYQKEGKCRFGIWSTIVEDVVAYDMTQSEVVNHQGQKAELRARQKTQKIVDQLQWGQDPYGYDIELPPQDVIEQLEAGDFE